MSMEDNKNQAIVTKEKLEAERDKAIAENKIDDLNAALSALKALEESSKVEPLSTAQEAQIQDAGAEEKFQEATKEVDAKIREAAENAANEIKNIESETNSQGGEKVDEKVEDKNETVVEDIKSTLALFDKYSESGDSSILQQLHGKNIAGVNINLSNGTVLYLPPDMIKSYKRDLEIKLAQLEPAPLDEQEKNNEISKLSNELEGLLSKIEIARSELDQFRANQNHNIPEGNKMSYNLSLLWDRRDVIKARLAKLENKTETLTV